MAISPALARFLTRRRVPLDLIAHRYATTPAAAAEAARVPGARVADARVFRCGSRYIMVVLPATHQLELELVEACLRRRLHAVEPDEVRALCPDCVAGSVPALGVAYGVDTYVDDSLLDEPDLYLDAGDHRALVHMSIVRFKELLGEFGHGHFSRPSGVSRHSLRPHA